jgi:DNA-binding FadR family transcriptional regulator
MSAVNDRPGSDSATSTRPFASVEAQTLAAQVSRRLVVSILRGDLEAGSQLPSENELARQFNVSRPVVREAVKEVEMLGLVRRRQGRLTQIAPSDEWRHLAPELLAARTEVGAVEDLMLELLELRRMVELEAAALAARRRTDDDLEAMNTWLDLMDADVSDAGRFAQHDIAFHDAVLTATRNNLLRPLYRQLRPLLELGREISAQVPRDGRLKSQRGHRAIHQAILDGDSDLARVAMSEHLSYTGSLQLTEREDRLNRSSRPRPPKAVGASDKPQ